MRKLLGAGLVVVLAGCGTTTLDQDEMHDAISAQYERQTKIALEDVDCPDTEAKKGATFRCTAENAKDLELTIDGTVNAVDGDRAKYRWDVTKAVAPGTLYAEPAQRQLEESVGAKAKALECPEEIVVKAGTEVRCTLVTLDDQRYGATLTLKDADGGFAIEVDRQPQS